MHNEEELIYKVRDVADVKAAPQPPIEEYISESLVGSDDDAPATRRVPPKVATFASRHTRQATGKIDTHLPGRGHNRRDPDNRGKEE
jgi:hypothetical protein